MKSFALVSLSLVWLAACDAPTAPTAPNAPTLIAPTTARASGVFVNERVPISGTYIYTCGPVEPVAFEGFAHVVRIGEPGDNRLHVNYQGVEGIGVLSGDRYIFQQNENSTGYISNDPFERASEVDQINRVIREGSDDNSWVRTTFKFSFPPFQFELIRAEAECRG